MSRRTARSVGSLCGLFFATSLALGLAGCYSEAPKSAPAKTAEVPIDTESSRREAKRPDPNEGEEVTAPPPEMASADAPPAAPGQPATAPAGGPGGARTFAPIASSANGAKLGKAQCDQMLDKYVELVIAGGGSPLKGTTGKELENARNMIKSMVSQDPNFQGFQKACLRDGTKAQHACAMAARHAEEFQNCIR
jgi:hypothetical protein